jgi:hypothetical protein
MVGAIHVKLPDIDATAQSGILPSDKAVFMNK